MSFVRVVSFDIGCDSKYKKCLNVEQQLVSNKLQFAFLCELYKILISDKEYNKREKRLGFGRFESSDLPEMQGAKRLELSYSNFRQYRIGASIEVELASPSFSNVHYTIDLVLSYNLKEKSNLLAKEES